MNCKYSGILLEEENVEIGCLSVVGQHDSRLYVNLKIKNLVIRALVSTATTCGVLFQSELLEKLQKEGGVQVVPVKGIMQAAIGKPSSVIGKCFPEIKVGNTVWKGKSLIAECLSYQAVVGSPFLEDLGASLDFGKGKLIINGVAVD